MKSHSQAGQDLFVHAILPHRNGLFVDVGCSHPTHWSNTFALESELGWRGVLIDGDENAVAQCRTQRTSTVICADATTFDWEIMRNTLGPVCDYASVDVDEWTYLALKNLLENGPAFKVMTVEHDHYQRGERLRIPNRELLAKHGYEIIAADVHSNGCCYEDWLVDPRRVDMSVASKFKSIGLDWSDVLKLGGVP